MNTHIFIASYLSSSSPKYFQIQGGIDKPLSSLQFNDAQSEQGNGISTKDRSINYGDGCFTTMYSEGITVFALDKHLIRLEQDTDRLGIKFCIKTVKHYLQQACANLLTTNIPASAIKILISRGSGGRGYEPPELPIPQVIISFYPTIKMDLRANTRTRYKKTTKLAQMRLSIQPLLAGIKHLNRLEQVLAKQELLREDCDDLLICNQVGDLIEASASNIFCLINDVWTTPLIVDSGVSGVMRTSIIEFMQLNNIPYEIARLSIQDVLSAESVFLCNSIKFIMPISSLYAQNKTVEYNVYPSFEALDNVYKWMTSELQPTLEAKL